MKKRMLAWLMAVMMVVTLMPAALAEGVNGTFEGTAKGFGGDVTVKVTLENSVITAIEAVGAEETGGIGSVALEKLPDQIVAANSVNVDVISTATFTSNGILEAVKAALVAAGLNPDDYMTKAEAAKPEDPTYDADIVIVGAGGDGITAAITAALSA